MLTDTKGTYLKNLEMITISLNFQEIANCIFSVATK